MIFTIISQNNHKDLLLSEGRYPDSASYNMREHVMFTEMHVRLEIFFQLFLWKIQSATELIFSFYNKAFTLFTHLFTHDFFNKTDCISTMSERFNI